MLCLPDVLKFTKFITKRSTMKRKKFLLLCNGNIKAKLRPHIQVASERHSRNLG